MGDRNICFFHAAVLGDLHAQNLQTAPPACPAQDDPRRLVERGPDHFIIAIGDAATPVRRELSGSYLST